MLFKEYFKDFIKILRSKEQDKVAWILKLIQSLDRIPKQYLKHLVGTEGLYEIKVELNNRTARIFCFFDDGNLVVLCNGFIKKKQKTPKNELQKAMEIRKEYYIEKSSNT